MIYRELGFLAVVLFGSSSPSPVSKLDRRLRGRLRKRDNLLTGEGEEEPNHKTARKPGLLLIILYSLILVTLKVRRHAYGSHPIGVGRGEVVASSVRVTFDEGPRSESKIDKLLA
jgi:hypothetical protein